MKSLPKWRRNGCLWTTARMQSLLGCLVTQVFGTNTSFTYKHAHLSQADKPIPLENMRKIVDFCLKKKHYFIWIVKLLVQWLLLIIKKTKTFCIMLKFVVLLPSHNNKIMYVPFLTCFTEQSKGRVWSFNHMLNDEWSISYYWCTHTYHLWCSDFSLKFYAGT